MTEHHPSNTTAHESGTPLVALRRPLDSCYNFLRELRGWPADCEARDCIDPELAGEDGTMAFSLMLLLAKSASNMKAEAPIFFAEAYQTPAGLVIVLKESGTGMGLVIFPRPSEALYKLACWMAGEITERAA